MQRFRLHKGKITKNKSGAYVRFSQVLDLLEEIEMTQQMYNGHKTCPMCDGAPHLGGHSRGCEIGELLNKEGRARMKVGESTEG